MHTITLNVAASALLLSGILCLGLLFKRTPSSRLGSSASVLSISDMSSSLLTSLLLLLNRFYHEPADGSSLVHESSNSSSTAAGEDSCDFKAVFFQYAVFLVPFANAFVSLLGFSTSCYTGASGIERRCSQLVEASSVQPAEQPKKRRRRSFPAVRRPYGTGLAILGQWLLPALFGGAFQLAEHRRIDLANHTMDDLACTLAANFPFENCAEELLLSSAPEIPNLDALGSSSSLHNYVSSEDNLLWPSPNSSQTLDLVSRIYAIVQSAVNDSISGRPAQRPHYNISQLLGASALLDESASSRSIGGLVAHRFYVSDAEDGGTLSQSLQVFRCAKNRCVVSTRFLQVQLFLFLSLVYFLPILASALLLVASHYKCREIARKLEDCRARNESAKPRDSAGLQVHIKDEDDACARFAEAACELSCENERMQSFYQVFKFNALLAVALWTPFFLQVISKSFFCSNVPGWLMEVAFLATIVFGVFRNALNLTVAKIDAEAEESKKHNSVHPN